MCHSVLLWCCCRVHIRTHRSGITVQILILLDYLFMCAYAFIHSPPPSLFFSLCLSLSLCSPHTRIRWILGYDPSEMVGLKAYQYFHPEDLTSTSSCHMNCECRLSLSPSLPLPLSLNLSLLTLLEHTAV